MHLDLRRPILSLLLFGAACGASAGLLDARPANDALLPVEQALELHAPLWDGKHLSLRWDIAPGCYLYRDKISVEAVEPAGYALGPATLPAGETLQDPHFGTVRVVRDVLQLRFQPASGEPPVTLRVRYQGCAEDRVCYPPQTRLIAVPAP